jgi:HPt (histidine-containing phosphotransfer) domain-containing protein
MPLHEAGDLIGDLIELFVRDTPARIAALQDAVQGAHAAAIREHAHFIKGCGLNLSLTQLAAHCAQMEAAAVSGHELPATAIDALWAHYHRACAALRQMRNELIGA